MKTTSCPDRQALLALLDDQLPSDDQARLALHLDQCRKCQSQLESLARGQIVPAVASAEAEVLSAGSSAINLVIEKLRTSVGDTQSGFNHGKPATLDFLKPPGRTNCLGLFGTSMKPAD